MEIKISNRSLISAEVLILAVIVAISMTTTAVLQKQDVRNNARDIAKNTYSIAVIEQTLSKVTELSKD